MLMQDSLTGYLHEVPEFGEPESYGEMAYHGFGNPVGFLRRRRWRRRALEPAQPTVPPVPPASAAPPAPMPAQARPGPEMAPEGGEQMPGEEVGEIAYDGLGNPVGWNPFTAVRRAVRGVVANPLRALGVAALPFTAAGLLPLLAQRLAAQRRTIQRYQMTGRPVPPSLMQSFQNISAQLQRARMSAHRRWPLGWIRPQLPYTGLGPRRLYLRCAVWPGPRGLVPRYAAQLPAAAPQIAPSGAAAISHHRRRRRRY